MSKRTNNIIYSDGEDSDGSGNSDSSGDDDTPTKKVNNEASNKRSKILQKSKPWGEELSDKLWTVYSQLRPSHETDIATANEISKNDSFSMYTPYQIRKKIANIKRRRATLGMSTTYTQTRVTKRPERRLRSSISTTNNKNGSDDDEEEEAEEEQEQAEQEEDNEEYHVEENYTFNDSDDDEEEEDEENGKDDNDEPSSGTTSNGRGGNMRNPNIIRIWNDDIDTELIKLYKLHRSSFQTDVAFAQRIIKDKSLGNGSRIYTPKQISRRTSYLRLKYNIQIPTSTTTTTTTTTAPPVIPPIIPPPVHHTPPSKQLLPIDQLELWTIFKSVRANYTSDTDTIKKLLENKKYSQFSYNQISTIVYQFKKKYGLPSNCVTSRGRKRSDSNEGNNNNNIAPEVPPLIDQEEVDDDEEEEDDYDEEEQIKEMTNKLKMYENENKGLKSKVGTLENKVTNLNKIIEEKKVKKEKKFLSPTSTSTTTTPTTYSSHLNDNTEIASSNSAAIIKLPSSNDDIYILFPTFSGGNTTLRVAGIVDNRYHIVIEYEHKSFVNTSNHFIKVMPGYKFPVSSLIKHNGKDTNGIYLKKLTPMVH